MWRWRRVAVARVFALVVRCRIMRLLVDSRVGKNRDTRRESPGGAGGGPYRQPLNGPLQLENSRGTEGNDIYRPVRGSAFYLINLSTISFTERAVSRYSKASFSSGIQKSSGYLTLTPKSVRLLKSTWKASLSIF